MNWLIIVGVISLALWFVREYMAVFVPENTALLLVDAWGKIRKVKSGLRFKRPWFFEKPVRKPEGGVIPLWANLVKVDGVFEAKNFTIKLRIAFIVTPIFDHLEDYIRFDNDQRIEGVMERVRSIMTQLTHHYGTREEIKADLSNITKEINKRFSDVAGETVNLDLEKYFGLNAQQFVVADTENPPELILAQNKLEAQKKENERQKIENENYGNMTEDLVKKSVELGSPMSTKEASDRVLIIQGKIKQNNTVYDIGPGAQQVLGGAVAGVSGFGKAVHGISEKLIEKLGDKKKKEEDEDGR